MAIRRPGLVILEEYLQPRGLSLAEVERRTGISKQALSDIVSGKTRITVDRAFKLESLFDRSAKYWLMLQMDYDIEVFRERTREADIVANVEGSEKQGRLALRPEQIEEDRGDG